MPEIVLYGVTVSAFVAKVRIALDFKSLNYRELPPPDGYGSAAYRDIVPAGSVPGLVIDGQPLHDSNAIIEWLEECWPEPALLPHGPYARARIRALLGFHDTRLEAAARQLFPVIKSDWRAQPEPIQTGLDAVNVALSRLSDLVEPDPFILGETPTIGDLVYPVTIQMAEMLALELERSLIVPPVLEDWRRRVANLPACHRSMSIARAAMDDWLEGFR